MKEYKFRGKEIDTGKWVYGGLFKEPAPPQCFEKTLEDKYWIVYPDPRYMPDWNLSYKMVRTDVDKETIGQYTGLKDKNEKEIYAGDIIEFSYDMFIGNFDTFVAKGKIVFEEGAFYVEVFENERTTEDEAYLLYSINLDTIEVIGNVWEDSDLLNDNKNTKNN